MMTKAEEIKKKIKEFTTNSQESPPPLGVG